MAAAALLLGRLGALCRCLLGICLGCSLCSCSCSCSWRCCRYSCRCRRIRILCLRQGDHRLRCWQRSSIRCGSRIRHGGSSIRGRSCVGGGSRERSGRSCVGHGSRSRILNRCSVGHGSRILNRSRLNRRCIGGSISGRCSIGGRSHVRSG